MPVLRTRFCWSTPLFFFFFFFTGDFWSVWAGGASLSLAQQREAETPRLYTDLAYAGKGRGSLLV